jgi:hypothetical protein
MAPDSREFGRSWTAHAVTGDALRLIDRRGHPAEFRCVGIDRAFARVYIFTSQGHPHMVAKVRAGAGHQSPLRLASTGPGRR